MSKRQSKVNFRLALWAELKQSNGYRIVATLYAIASAVAFVMWLISTRSPAQLLTSWTRSDKIILVLIFICIWLIILLFGFFAGARRIYEKTVRDINTEHESKVQELKRKYIRRRKRVQKKLMTERTTLRQFAKELTDANVARGNLEIELSELEAERNTLKTKNESYRERLNPKLDIKFGNTSPYVRTYVDGLKRNNRIISVMVENTSETTLTDVHAEVEGLTIGVNQFPPLPMLVAFSKEENFTLSPNGKKYLTFTGTVDKTAVMPRDVNPIYLPNGFECQITIVAYANEALPCRKRAILDIDITGFVSLKADEG